MWRVSLAAGRASRDENLPFHLPVVIGKAVMGIISAASQAAVDAHGIGMVPPPVPSHCPAHVYKTTTK